MTWAIYVRVSSEEQAADSLSLDAQLRALRDWAGQRQHSVREFVDAGKSAWTEDLEKRPAFQAMIDGVRRREFDGVAVTHLDRFSRKLIVTLQVFGVLGKYNTKFICLESASLDFSSPMGALVLSTLGAFAEYYSSELSRKIKRGLSERAARGLHVGTLPFGYCNGRCTDCKRDKACPRWGTLSKDMPPVLHPEDAPGVRLAFEAYRTGAHTDETVSTLLNEKGYRSRNRQSRELWNKFSVSWLLTNLTYTGRLLVNGTNHAGRQTAIISAAVFEEVQAVRGRHLLTGRTYTPKHRTYLFSGIIYCSGCGRRMRAKAIGQRDMRVYLCTAQESKKVICAKPQWHIHAHLLEDQMGEIVKRFRLPADWRQRIRQVLSHTENRTDVEQQRRGLSDRLARLDVMFEMGRKPEGEYRADVDRIKRELATLTPTGEHAVIDAGIYLESLAAAWDAATPAERREMVLVMFERVECDPALKRLMAFKPKPTFVPLFRQHPALVERDGVFEIPLECGREAC